MSPSRFATIGPLIVPPPPGTDALSVVMVVETAVLNAVGLAYATTVTVYCVPGRRPLIAQLVAGATAVQLGLLLAAAEALLPEAFTVAVAV
jgi:hypothetical protein